LSLGHRARIPYYKIKARDKVPGQMAPVTPLSGAQVTTELFVRGIGEQSNVLSRAIVVLPLCSTIIIAARIWIRYCAKQLKNDDYWILITVVRVAGNLC